MKKLKTQRGITLIALIITIVVLLILAVVAIGAAQDSNIVGYAQNAASEYETGKGKENNAISDMEALLNKYSTGGNSAGNSNGSNNGGTTDNPSGGNIGGTDEPEIMPPEVEEPDPTPVTHPAYEMGDTVTIGTESFYVIETSDETQDTLVLLAKERINTSTYKQSASASSISFSSTNYWASEFTSSPYDLVEIGEPSADHYAAYHAYKYAKTIDQNATGRLMTYLEARTIRDTSDSLRNVIFGTESTSGRVNYWLGSARGTDMIYVVDGSGKVLSDAGYSSSSWVRSTTSCYYFKGYT